MSGEFFRSDGVTAPTARVPRTTPRRSGKGSQTSSRSSGRTGSSRKNRPVGSTLAAAIAATASENAKRAEPGFHDNVRGSAMSSPRAPLSPFNGSPSPSVPGSDLPGTGVPGLNRSPVRETNTLHGGIFESTILRAGTASPPSGLLVS
jgi:hypothetical protein